MTKSSIRRLLSGRTLFLFVVHLLLFALAYLLAILMRFDFSVPPAEWSPWLKLAPWLLLVKVSVFYWLGSFHGWWRFVTFADLVDLLKAASASAACVVAIDYFVVSYHVPRGIHVLDFITTVVLFGGLRSSYRLLQELSWLSTASSDARLAVVVGANQAGELIVRQTKANRALNFRVVGFLDNNAKHRGLRYAGLPILGPPSEAKDLVTRARATLILVTANSMSGDAVRRLMKECREVGVAVKVIPPVEEILNKGHKLQLRDPSIDDLLRREPITLDTTSIAQLLQGRRVMVTGAGGSIASEICRQVARFEPESIILVERFEGALFAIDRELRSRDSTALFHPCIGDILDEDRMEALFDRHRPHVVFHAAAHKHVPMMEFNPGEAIKNNVFGTQCVANLAGRYEVERFVLISTDKAVNPTSIMGVSKQLAERCVHAMPTTFPTRYMVVRFGNVLGSTGSVVPIFQEQINRGGPVTVTHPDMVRFFMTIPEASQLVLQAAAIGKGGELFVLDMGEPVRIMDLVHDMICLSGASLDEIEIQYTGIRPGEKLFEELCFDEEQMLPTSHPKVQVAYHRPFDEAVEHPRIEELRSVLGSKEQLLGKLEELVPEYRPSRAREGAEDGAGTVSLLTVQDKRD